MELLITFLAGVSILLGPLLVCLTKKGRTVEHLSMSMAMAALLSLLLFDLGPEVREAIEHSGWALPVSMVFVGVVLLSVLDRFIPEHEDNEQNHDEGNAAHIGIISSLALLIHNVVEGMSMYLMSAEDLKNGAIFAFGVALHNIPMGMFVFTAIKRQSRRSKAVVLGMVTLSTLLGGVLMAWARTCIPHVLGEALLAMATGMIVYIVAFELVPHVLRTKERLLNIVGALIGFGLVYVSTLIAAE